MKSAISSAKVETWDQNGFCQCNNEVGHLPQNQTSTVFLKTSFFLNNFRQAGNSIESGKGIYGTSDTWDGGGKLLVKLRE